MKYALASVALATLSGLANALISITNTNFANIKVGEPYEITWIDATGPVTINLKNGPSIDLDTVSQITTGATGGSFTWTPSSSLTSGNYAFEITDGDTTNFSMMFTLTGGAVTTTISSTTMSITSSSSSSTASSTSTMESDSTTSTTSSASSSSTATNTTMTTSKTSSTASSTGSTTSSASTSETATPNTNGAAGKFAPILAPILLVLGFALL
ncbi:hypothetical protein F5Y15DRAFT_418404 [Xylariaceae sp. FL0016]|nr:hypothetical protein F5Y15DRAFT_418404 [Xylariaceae sp. FL0016]